MDQIFAVSGFRLACFGVIDTTGPRNASSVSFALRMVVPELVVQGQLVVVAAAVAAAAGLVQRFQQVAVAVAELAVVAVVLLVLLVLLVVLHVAVVGPEHAG